MQDTPLIPETMKPDPELVRLYADHLHDSSPLLRKIRERQAERERNRRSWR